MCRACESHLDITAVKGFTHMTRTPFGGPNAKNFRPTHSGTSKMAHRRVPGLCRLDASSSLSELLHQALCVSVLLKGSRQGFGFLTIHFNSYFVFRSIPKVYIVSFPLFLMQNKSSKWADERGPRGLEKNWGINYHGENWVLSLEAVFTSIGSDLYNESDPDNGKEIMIKQTNIKTKFQSSLGSQ